MTLEEALESARVGRADPVLWAREILGVELWSEQERILASLADPTIREVNVAACHGPGKSFIAAVALLWYVCNHPDSLVPTTAPGLRQVKDILWREVNRLSRKAIMPLGLEVITTQAKFTADWYAFGFTSPDYDDTKMQGFHNEHLLLIVDEAAGISPLVWDGMASASSGQNAKVLRIGNPTAPTSAFCKALQTPRDGRLNIHIPAYDTPNFTHFGIVEDDMFDGTWRGKIAGEPLPWPALVAPQWVADRIADGWTRGTPQYQSRVLGQIPDAADYQLITWPAIRAAIARSLPFENEAGETIEPHRLALDIARTGGDESVMVRRRGGHVRLLWNHTGQLTNVTKDRARESIKELGAEDCVIDAVGMGAGIYDDLNNEGWSVVEYNAGNAAERNDRYVNRRAEDLWALRMLFEEGKIDIDPDDLELHAQLASLRYFLSPNGRTGAVDKRTSAKASQGVKSPDRADAVMMAFGGGDPWQLH